MIDPLPTERAQFYALQIQQQLDASGYLDYEHDKSVSIDYLFGPARGQMFGVLVCIDEQGREIVLKAFSGQYDGKYLIKGWVPPALDTQAFESIVQTSQETLHELELQIQEAQLKNDATLEEDLKVKRKKYSQNVQKSIFDLYQFHCIDKEIRTIGDIFGAELPPTGTGDCCAPKLLNYAFLHNLHPMSMAEWFYGSSNKSQDREHKTFYPPCDSRCKAVLAAQLTIDIIYRDDAIIVVNKPSGLLSVPGRGEDKQDCIVNRVKRLYPLCIEQPSVHRLDMDTSGLLLLAFTQEAHRNLSIQFIKRQVHKRYIALLEGVITTASGTIELAFRYDPDNKPRQKYDPVLGKWGTTEWEKVRVEPFGEDGRQVSRILFTPLTGRTHQLRVHSAHELGLGHPIVGDPLYGTGQEAPRLMLHAYEIQFTHPITEESFHITVEADF